MRDIGLVKGALVVLAFWWFVIQFAINGVSAVVVVFPEFIDSLQTVTIGVLIGLGMYFFYDWINDASIKEMHTPTPLRGMNVTIGGFPAGVKPPKGSKKTGDIFENKDLNEWFVGYEKSHPLYADLFRAFAGIMHEFKTLPASPVPGGHGNLTLLQHSENVLIEMLRQAPNWKYVGHVGKSGKILVQPIDGTWLYEKELKDSPILPLIAYAHDIGKVECYVPFKNHVKEVKKGHDSVGKQIVIRMDEYWALPPLDREVISMSMGYYHHISSLPLWCNDKIRAATELLIYVDMATGRREGGVQNEYEEYTTNDPNAEFSSLAASMTDDDIGEALSNVSESVSKIADLTEIPMDDSELEKPTPKSATTSTEQPTVVEPPKPKPVPVNSNHEAQVEWMYEVFCGIISQPGRINGKDPKRIGFKKNGLIYLNDADWRAAAAKELGNDDVSKIENGQINTATYLVLEALKKRGKLYCVHEGFEYSTKRALFRIQSYLPIRGKKAIELGTKTPGSLWSHTMIFYVDAISALLNIDDTDGEFEILQASWGATSALNKASGPIVQKDTEQNPEPLSQSEVDNPSPGFSENIVTGESASHKVFAELRKQHLNHGTSDIPFSIEPHKDKVLQVVRLDLLSAMHPDIDWTKEPGFINGKDKNKNRVCCLILEERPKDV